MRNATAIAAVTGILLAGCQSSMVSRTNIEPFFHPTMVGYVTAKHGHMPVAVYGTPFGTDKATSDAAVASAMRMPGSFQAAEFKATAEAMAGQESRIALVFDPPIAFNGRTICDLSPEALNRAAGTGGGPEMRVRAAFCVGGGLASSSHLSLPRPTSAGDPAFRSGMDALLGDLLPPENPELRPDAGEWNMG